MKALKLLLALVATALGVSAQQVIGPATGFAFVTNTAVFMVPGVTTTNLPTTIVRNMSVGALGVGFAINVAGTNSVSTTNCTITLEGTVNGTEWIDIPATALPVLSVPQNGTTESTYYTNLIAATAPNVGNIRWLRVKSIQNTNLASIFFTNFVWSAR